jgi:uncharacterized protein YcnI
MRSCPRALSRTAVVGIAAAAGILLLQIPAAAHVSVTPDSVAPGSAAVLTFHVPNEEASADTTQVDMRIPTDHPIAQVLAKPVPGWTISVRTITLAKPLVTDDGQFSQAVSEIIWSGGRIAPGQFQDFSVSADPVPEGVGRLAFKTIQTYSNGDVVSWIDISQPGQPEPDHPAPVLTVTAVRPAAPITAPAPGSDPMSRVVAFGALACGVGALVLAALDRRRRSAAATAGPGPQTAPRDPAPAVVVVKPPAGAAPVPKPGAGRAQAQRRTADSRRDHARH